ncbi:MAG: acyl--CoA ligase [Sterolibacterium sp.]|jgi:long-chain acyl-CoA synthetase|nr:acyl--CoA ligase [Sterolibacterium sp.]
MTDTLPQQLQAVAAQLSAADAPYELSEIQHDGQPYRIYKNAPANLADLINQGRGFADKEFLVWQGQRLSYADFYRQVDALLPVLRTEYKINKGDRVAIAMRNRPEWMAAFAAIILCGGVAVPLNSWGQREELLHGLTDSTPRLLFCDAQRLAHVSADLLTLKLPAIVVDAERNELPPSVTSYTALLARQKTTSDLPAITLEADDLAMIMYTSGTSSLAKGVTSTHRAMCQGVVNLEYFGALFVMTSPERFGAMMAQGFEMTTLMAVPLFHSSGLHAQFLSALRTGRRLVIMYKWDVGAVLETIARERVTQLSVSPAMMLQLFNDPRFEEADTRSLAWLGFGGGSVPDPMLALVARKKPQAMAGIGYGLTETNGPSNAATGEAFAWKPRSNGPTSPIFDVRIVDENGNTLPQGERGEVWLRGITLMQGYWNKPKATREVLQDGWLHSGDIGYFDEDGFLFIVDRIKDIINRGGEKIASAEVESVLLAHPAIVEAAAFAVADTTYGEALAVAVHLRPGTSLSADDVRNHVAAHLAAYKIPGHVVFHEQGLPRNVVDKVLKRQLRSAFEQG